MAWHDEDKQRFEFEFAKIKRDDEYGLLEIRDGKAFIMFTREGLEQWIADQRKWLDDTPKE